MAAKTTSWLTRARVFRTLLSDIYLAVRLLREPVVPVYLKVVPFAALAYVLSPLDIIPDFLPIVGQLDDIGFLILGLKLFLRLCPGDAVDFHREALDHHLPFAPMSPADQVIDAEFHRQ
jgi:uncharacterized membrane protein YkvA (DUF1232 family)